MSNQEKVSTTAQSNLPHVLSLCLIFISTLAIIAAGYIHGNMQLLTTLKNARS